MHVYLLSLNFHLIPPFKNLQKGEKKRGSEMTIEVDQSDEKVEVTS
jgi:hypothetical protein